MNYLAHILLAHKTGTSKTGNFLGDFVRGNVQSSGLPPDIQLGIMLHRKIDSFTDAHPITRNSRNCINATRRRFAGIIIDLAYDHFLARHWHAYCDVSIDELTDQFYFELANHQPHLPESSQTMVSHLLENRWLTEYQTMDGISRGLNGIARRYQNKFNRKIPLTRASEEIEKNFTQLEQDFKCFFPQLIQYSHNVARTYNESMLFNS